MVSPIEGKLLYRTAKLVRGEGCILEIGSWLGRATVRLAMGSKHGSNVKVYAVDPHKGSVTHKKYGLPSSLHIFLVNIKKFNVDDIVVPIVATSEDAHVGWDKPIELIFVDGNHEYEYVRKDLLLWFKHLVAGGIIAFHDSINFEGVNEVLKKYVYASSSFKNIGLIGSITFAEKSYDLTFVDTVLNKIKSSVYLSLLKKLPGKIRRLVMCPLNRMALAKY